MGRSRFKILAGIAEKGECLRNAVQEVKKRDPGFPPGVPFFVQLNEF